MSISPTEDRLYREIAGLADAVAFWKFQAIWHRAKLSGRDPDDDQVYRDVEKELAQARADENRERYSHAYSSNSELDL